jgi:hypothetical protein
VSLNWRYYFSGREELIDSVVNFFTAKATNPVLFNDIVAVCKQIPQGSAGPNHDTMLNLGFLSLQDFLHYEAQQNPGKGIATALVQRLLDQLCAKAILVREPLLQTAREGVYSLNDGLAQYLYERHLIKNVILGFDYIVNNYRQAVAKILVSTREGDEGIGTGFLFNVQSHEGDTAWSIVITNEHVAKHEKHLQVMSVDNEVKEYNRIFHSGKYDAAAIVLRDFWDTPAFHLYPDPKLLDDIVIAGYPPVPTTKDAYQLVHKGEINSFVTDYWGNDFFLFSAKTSPGNSGGPVINDMGMVVGMVTQQLFEKGAFETRGQLPYFAAIPSARILDFFNEAVAPNLAGNQSARH